jgi:16S rRNA C967 or C1407 C5-methylase (RsmB/RsmF family)/NOL1/NOP2/fmu family ribosome biogenesis protein
MKPLPEKFEHAMRAQLGAEFPEFLARMQEPPPASIRTNPVKFKGTGDAGAVPWSRYGKYLPERPVFTLDPLFHAGSYYVQEASSMFLEQALEQSVDLRQPLRFLDLCAAPGGKSTHILSMINRESLLVSNETIRSRANILSENIQKWGYPNAVVTNNDPADFNALKGFFDVILVDAPCSGEGLFRKEPDAINEWTPENVNLCASRQRRIVSDVWDALREGGIFIYCTCTYNTLENEENLAWMAKNHDVEFLTLSIDPGWGVEETSDVPVRGYRFFPHKARGEGFFLAVMRKRETAKTWSSKAKRSIDAPTAKIQERLRPWIRHGEDVRFFRFNDLLFYAPLQISFDMEAVIRQMRIVYAGTNIATVKHDKLIPEHALSLSIDLDKGNFPVVDLSRDDALKYLRRETIDPSGSPAGFALVRFQELPLGWVNILSNRVNNLYPSGWRIRMSTPSMPPKSPPAAPRR